MGGQVVRVQGVHVAAEPLPHGLCLKHRESRSVCHELTTWCGVQIEDAKRVQQPPELQHSNVDPLAQHDHLCKGRYLLGDARPLNSLGQAVSSKDSDVLQTKLSRWAPAPCCRRTCVRCAAAASAATRSCAGTAWTAPAARRPRRQLRRAARGGRRRRSYSDSSPAAPLAACPAEHCCAQHGIAARDLPEGYEET